MDEFERDTLYKHTPCNFKSSERVIQALAKVHVELVLIHPFREGNGRVARILSTIMVFQAGLLMLNFKDITDRKRKEYFAAINRGLSRDYKPMERLLRELLSGLLNLSPFRFKLPFRSSACVIRMLSTPVSCGHTAHADFNSAGVMRMPSTAEEVITFLINEDSYFFESFKYGLVSFNGFLFHVFIILQK